MEILEKYRLLVEEGIRKHQFTEKPAELYDPINYILETGGKRLRPVLLLLACELFNGDIDKALKPALAIEFFHNFTLIHDDIMDEAPVRRNKPTIHNLYGTSVGILSGDALMIKAYQFFEDLEPELFKKCVQIFSETAARLCEGQQFDVNFESKTKVSHKEYLQMISYKTGVLIGASLKIGALIGGADEKEADCFYDYGLNLGVAFQIMDDYLDVFGNEEAFGKKHGGDITENKKTILYLLAEKYGSKEDKEELHYWYSKKTENIDKVYSVEKIFRKISVDKKVKTLIKKSNEKAMDCISTLGLSEDKVKILEAISTTLLKRSI